MWIIYSEVFTIYPNRCKQRTYQLSWSKQVAGACECKPGYSGYKCDQCAAGYRQFPDCMPCPCDSRGILPSHDCEGDCLCKANVAGDFCDRCKSGYFALTRDNLDGCLPCYCFDATDRCTTARLSYSMVSLFPFSCIGILILNFENSTTFLSFKSVF